MIPTKRHSKHSPSKARHPLHDVSPNPSPKRTRLQARQVRPESDPYLLDVGHIVGRVNYEDKKHHSEETQLHVARGANGKGSPKTGISNLGLVRTAPPTSNCLSNTADESNPTHPSFFRDYVEIWLEQTYKLHQQPPVKGYSSNKMDGISEGSTSSLGKRRRPVDEGVADDVDATPRPPRTRTSLKLQGGGFEGSSNASHSQSTSSRRSGSPVKRITDMRFFSSPVVMTGFDDPIADIPEGLGDVHRQITRYSRGIGVISIEARKDIQARQERSFRNIDFDAFGQTKFPTPSPTAVAHVASHARICDTRGHSEASWNCLVHSPLLDMALCDCGYPVGFLNCTTARIQPTELIPITYSGVTAESKMVDFAIYIEETAESNKGMTRMATLHPSTSPSWNQTFDPPLCTTPIAVSIETKRPGIEWDKAIVQVSIWAAAQFRRLEQLLGDSGHGGQDIPFLPLFVVQGHDWTFLAATRDADGRMRIWSKVIVGSTTSPLGVYQIVATLRLLAGWITEVYKPWFWKYVLGSTGATP
ncbi:hypothetical protein G7Y89_g14603 [Cudoniella acicularis]|uniref:PD-(D/E)XK nuclease-like domain-containing protein n=1 Tax=Cudoniella acicularis TaxID=354080 RepID=A0A8H4VS94_9HELO|nr:hypothetical protein G7Y89_g14603 [Cudoniella acicularis]